MCLAQGPQRSDAGEAHTRGQYTDMVSIAPYNSYLMKWPHICVDT